jgi:hypothetical protein
VQLQENRPAILESFQIFSVVIVVPELAFACPEIYLFQ